MSSARYVRSVNKWRDQYNPLRGLTIRAATTLLEAGERGEYANLQWLYRFIEKRNATLRATIARRLSALGRLDWDVKEVEKAPNPELAKKQAQFLRSAYERIDNLSAAIRFLALATFRGYSHLEKHYTADGRVIHFEPVPQWYWVRDGINGDWQYNPEARGGTYTGIDIDPSTFIIREVDAPVDEIGLIAFLRQSMSQKDWDGFIETYGIPPLFIEMPPNVPQDKESEYQAQAEAVIGDARGTMPNGAKVQTVDAGSRGVNPFESHIRYQDECMVLAATGGKLTMLTQSGSGTLAGGAHSDTFMEIASDEAMEISEIFQTQFDKPLLAEAFPGQPIYAYFAIAANENIVEVLKNAKEAKQGGFQMDAEQFTTKTGIKVTVAPTPREFPSGAPLTNSNRTTGSETKAVSQAISYINEAVSRLESAKLAAMQPVIDRLNELIDGADEEFFPGLRQLIDDLPELGAKAGADQELIDAWREALGGALAIGLTTDNPKAKRK